VGEQSNFVLNPMFKAALEQILDWGVEHIQTYTKNLSREPVTILQDLGCRVEAEVERCGHLFGVRLEEQNFDFQQLLQAFAEQNAYVSFRGNAIRVAPHLYNDEADFTKLIYCFEQARKRVLI
jgi:selenocysteine lyase/cysteine desulfurase